MDLTKSTAKEKLTDSLNLPTDLGLFFCFSLDQNDQSARRSRDSRLPLRPTFARTKDAEMTPVFELLRQVSD